MFSVSTILMAAALGKVSQAVAHHKFGLSTYTDTLEIVWVQDFSESFADDLPLITQQLPDTFEELKWLFPHSRFALAGFVDKPLTDKQVNSGDYCYKLRYRLTRYTSRIRESLSKALIHSGGDWHESQLEAMLNAAKSKETGWTDGDTTPNGYVIHKFMVLATDSGFHKQGDTDLPPNNADGNADCLQEDYPSVEQLKNALNEKMITPVFLVTEEVMPIYRNLVKDLGNTGAAWVIRDDSSDIRAALSDAIQAVLDKEKAEADWAEPACSGDGCNVGCVGEFCCEGEDCDKLADNAVMIHFDNLPKKLRVIADTDDSAGVA